ncbi:MAG TPA: transglutaminase family protein [Opitutaceae bacterium]
MKLRVSHLTRYQYDREVGFSPHILYLRPRESPLHRLRSFSLNISPSAKVFAVRDPHDNALTWAHFWDRADALNIRTEFEIETLDDNPFDFILKLYAASFPFAYEPVFDFALGPYLAPPFDKTQSRLRAWLDEHFVNRPADTVSYLSQLNALVFEKFTYERRETGGIQPSVVTLERGAGACRDFAVLFVELCRTLGLAARFVSGYLYAPADDNHRTAGAMHAWTEVYLPGAGWKGLDPTHGLWCNDAFIPVAHAAQAESVNPIQGSYYNPTTASSSLHTDVVVEKID